MTDPDSHDDDWSELTRELGLENAPPPTDEPAPEPEDAEPFAEAAPLSDEEAEVAEGEEGEEMEGEGGADVAPGGEGQPGTGRKRRRRRRRRKKGGAADVEATGPLAEAAAGGEDEESPDTYSVSPVEEDAEAEEEGAVEIEPEAAPLAAEEDTGGELLRDLIATWNVPSWDEIVGGLYRPDR